MKLRDLLELMDNCKVYANIENDNGIFALSGEPKDLLTCASDTTLGGIVRMVTTMSNGSIYISTEVDCE